ncbi:AAA family ATPase [Haloplanus litoreus]|uniref:AAA family ATPase n=1 Tax=Haloplanus litoreus TaxID=767515 RepID=UPI0036176D0C
MITDPRVFEDDHLPRELMHRESAVETLLRAWDHTRLGEAGDEVIIAGPSGVGKTALARHTLQRLATQAAIDHTHVRCLGATPASVLRTVCRGSIWTHRVTPRQMPSRPTSSRRSTARPS